MKKSIVALIALLLLLGGAYTLYETKKDYIDGNILHLEYLNDNSVKGFSIAPPWVDNGLVYYLLFKPLILPNVEMTEFKPALAKSFTVSADNLTYTFECYDNLKWSDNMPLTIDDIYFSLEFAKASPLKTPLLEDIYENIKNIHVDGNILTIELEKTHSTFLLSLSQFIIYPKHIFEKGMENIDLNAFWNNPICSGMYIVTEVNDEYNKLEPNPYYVGEKPKIAEILLHKKADKRLDSYFSTNIADMVNYKAMRGYTEYNLDVSFYRYFVFNIQGNDGHVNSAMNDINIRAAIANSINNQAILQSIYLNAGSTFTILDKHAYSVDKAKEHIKNSNYDLTRPLRLGYYYEDATSLYFLQAIVKNLEEAGFIVDPIKAKSADEFIVNRNFDILLKDTMVLSPSDWSLELYSKHNYARIFGGEGEFDTLIAQAREEVSTEKQLEIIKEINTKAAEYIYRYPVISLNQAIYMSPRVVLPKGFKYSNPWYMTDVEFEKWEIKKK